MREEIRNDLFDNNLFMDDKEDLMLKGCRCSSCEKAFFPARNRCPECLKPGLSPVPLGRECSLYSYTTVHIPSKNFKPPYTVGYVELEEGVRVFSQIRLKEDQTLKIGLPMKMCIDYLWEEQEGKSVAAYFFEPLDN